MTSRSPTVSIGVPVYNGADYLREALDSILSQTFDDLEVIISDNASEDDTQLISEEYAAKDPRVRYERNETNRGAAWNYNHVVVLARGKYFKWAAHDDWLAPAYIERCVAELESSDSVALVYPRTILVCEDPAERDFYGGNHIRYEDRLDTRHTDPIHRLRHVTKNLGLCNAVMGMYPRDTLLRTGLIRPFSGSDVVLLSEISLLGEIHEVPEWLFYRRRHQGASRLANRTPETVERWFKARSSKRRIVSAKTRLLGQNVRLIWDSSLPLLARVRGIFSYVATRMARRVRTIGGRYKRKLMGQSGALRALPEEPVKSNNREG